jgi:hypothetical protein
VRVVLLLWLALVFQAPPAVVTGVVMDGQAKHPIAYARVLMARTNGPLASSVTARADERGQFNIAVTPGTYRVVATHDDYIRGEASSTIEAGAAPIEGIVVTLVPTAVISGRIVDELGDPAIRVFVRALVNTKTVVESRTDDLGAYRLFGLAPGAYVIKAERHIPPHIQSDRYITPAPPCPDCAADGQSVQSVRSLMTVGGFIDPAAFGPPYSFPQPVYFPGVTRVQDAQPIEVWPGARVINIDLRLVRSPRP